MLTLLMWHRLQNVNMNSPDNKARDIGSSYERAVYGRVLQLICNQRFRKTAILLPGLICWFERLSCVTHNEIKPKYGTLTKQERP